MKIAICEDDNCDAELLIRLIRELEGISVTDRFISAEQILAAYSHGKRYDLVFMDIQMPGINGFKAAKIIHNEYHEERPLIAFLTITDKYVFDAYNVGWDYVCKPIERERIRQLYTRAQAELSYRKILLHTTEGSVYFESKSIIYIESFYGMVNIITKQSTHKTRMTLETIQKLLGNRPFLKIHRLTIKSQV